MAIFNSYVKLPEGKVQRGMRDFLEILKATRIHNSFF